MEEIEVPTEHLHEAIQEKAEESKEKWTLMVALSTAFMAVLAAIAGLLSGHHANEAVMEQIQASDRWSYYQAKGIKSEIAASTGKILGSFPGKTVPPENEQAVAKYEKEKEEIMVQAKEFEASAKQHFSTHVTLSKAVTIFQVAIAISAISILTRRKIMWYGGILLTLIGATYLIMGVL
jgi:Domain of unknown function (DUF4337)